MKKIFAILGLEIKMAIERATNHSNFMQCHVKR